MGRLGNTQIHLSAWELTLSCLTTHKLDLRGSWKAAHMHASSHASALRRTQPIALRMQKLCRLYRMLHFVSGYSWVTLSKPCLGTVTQKCSFSNLVLNITEGIVAVLLLLSYTRSLAEQLHNIMVLLSASDFRLHQRMLCLTTSSAVGFTIVIFSSTTLPTS